MLVSIKRIAMIIQRDPRYLERGKVKLARR